MPRARWLAFAIRLPSCSEVILRLLRQTHAAEEGLGGDTHVRKQAGIAVTVGLAFDPGHEGGSDAAMLMAVVDIKAVDLTFRCQLDEADDSSTVVGDQDAIAAEAPLPEGIRIDTRRPGADLLRNLLAAFTQRTVS